MALRSYDVIKFGESENCDFFLEKEVKIKHFAIKVLNIAISPGFIAYTEGKLQFKHVL